MKIGLLFERQTDLMSAPGASEVTHYHWREPEEVEAIAQALTSLGHEVDRIAPLDALLTRVNNPPDLVWNLSVRAQSRNRTALAPALLEQLGIPYTGADAAVKSLTLNKDWLKPVLQWCHVSTPPWIRYSLDEAIALPPWPVSILKPACEGYSLGLIRFDTVEGLECLQEKVMALCQQFHCSVLCEPLIVGREITVGAIGNGIPGLMGAVETVTLSDEPLGEQVLDLNAKRRGGFKKVTIAPTDPQLPALQAVVKTLFQLLSPLDYATFDFRVAADQIYLLDINADATLHPDRSLAKIAYAAGLSHLQLIALILQTCQERWHL
jgi:D-alanine-D-alanine ligase